MAGGVAALQGEMVSLSISAPCAASTSGFWAHRLSTFSATPAGIEGPIHSSNVTLYPKENNVTSRVGHKFLEDGTKVR
uniref:Large ribosomal subunit protein uL24 C-terminal domain-containing protein n=1 Tax=Leersia perrieri TaxID=77586 RepID=A0A0D9WTC7_9ORYZ